MLSIDDEHLYMAFQQIVDGFPKHSCTFHSNMGTAIQTLAQFGRMGELGIYSPKGGAYVQAVENLHMGV